MCIFNGKLAIISETERYVYGQGYY